MQAQLAASGAGGDLGIDKCKRQRTGKTRSATRVMALTGHSRHFLIFLGWKGSIQHENVLKRTYFGPAGSLRQESVIFPDFQKVKAPNSWILHLNWIMVMVFLRNSSFTISDGFIIDSSRYGSIFWPCMMSPTYFPITEAFFFLGTTSFLCPVPPVVAVVHPLQPISGPCSIEIIYPCELHRAIPASWMRVD